MRIVDYEIVFSGDAANVTLGVRELLKRGWQPYGGLAVTDKTRFQVMVKYENE